MEFHEKLDLIMNLTKTTNSMLSRQISVDASYISRLRTGSRRPAKNADYIRPMSTYFARHCHGPQMDALRAAMGNASGLESEDKKTDELLFTWLRLEERDVTRPVGAFLDCVSKFSFKKLPPVEVPPAAVPTKPREGNVEIFYANEGKRQAAIRFLNDIIRQEGPRTLLLYSEENFAWLTEKHDFTLLWASLLQEALRRGNRIRIIHNISRQLEEMLAGISEWLPIYMTGMVEPYYYPKARDGIFQRTLFVAPGLEAVLSTSVTGRTARSANYIVYDAAAVEAAAAEFSDYFELCRPLLRIFRASDSTEALRTLEEFSGVEADAIVRTSAQSILTMPETELAELCRTLSDTEQAAILASFRRRNEIFRASIGSNRIQEIIRTPDLEEVRAGRMKVALPEFINATELYYTPETYRRYLQHIISLLKRYDNYSVYFDDSGKLSDMIIYVKEGVGVLVAKTTTPSVLFAIGESKMTAAFWDYMKSWIGTDHKKDRSRAIDRLEAIIECLNNQ